MFAVLAEQGIRIIESTTVVNQTDMAYIGRGMGITGQKGGPTLGFSLPVDCNSTAVSIVDSDLDLPHIDCTDFGFYQPEDGRQVRQADHELEPGFVGRVWSIGWERDVVADPQRLESHLFGPPGAPNTWPAANRPTPWSVPIRRRQNSTSRWKWQSNLISFR